MAISRSKTQSIVEIEEVDHANNLTATYIKSTSAENGSRLDVIIQKSSTSYAKNILNAFLPAGYPHSVTEDYLQYQIYDSLQAFSSSIAGMLSSRAVLEGIGVGDSNASPTSALILSVLQESMGRIATILFAHRLGTALEPECKMYRFAADIFNDAAMILDCLSPAFPKPIRVVLLSASSVLRALCGVAAGSSKASLSAHFATQGNLGELNAKDSSQETIISLMGMLVGTLVVSHVSSKWATWTLMIFLLAIHLGTNYMAVRAVCMQTLNRQRANLVFSSIIDQMTPNGNLDYIEDKTQKNMKSNIKWPIPEEVSAKEKVFEKDGVLRSKGRVLGYCRVGVNLQTLWNSLGSVNKGTKHDRLQQYLDIFQHDKFIVAFKNQQRTYFVVLKEGANTSDILCAWMFVMLVAKSRISEERQDTFETLEKTRKLLVRIWPEIMERLGEAGWDLEIDAIQTRSGARIRIKEELQDVH